MGWGLANLKNFAKDRGGSVAIIFGFALFVMLGAIGLAIDAARVYAVSNQIARAVDAAVLAGAKLMNETSADDGAIIATATASFNANVADLVANGTVISAFTVVPDRATSGVDITLNVKLPTTIGRVAGLGNFDFNKRATAIYKIPQMEVVLALDVTGSMNSTPPGDARSKLATMKTVAKDMVDSLFNTAVNNQNIRIGLVPWSSSVNAGSYAAAATGHAGYSGCVLERTGGGATTDEAPSASNNAAEFGGAGFGGSNVCPDARVRALAGRNDRSEIKEAINDFSAGGMTAGHLGMAWGWYMLSPNWATYFPTDRKPKAYSSGAIKAVIMMTDGVFNTSYFTGSPSAAGTYDDASYADFQTICSNMRAQGVKVYTVLFALVDARAITELETCAGSAANAYTAANAAQLSAAFTSIIKKLASIRVAK